MGNLTNDSLLQIASQVMEEAAFLFAEPAEDSELTGDEPIESVLPFHGATLGKLVLLTTRDFGRELAANLLGVEMDDPAIDDKSLDAVGEVLNMIGGAVARTLADRGPITLAVPTTKPMQPSTAAEFAKATCAASLVAGDGAHKVVVAVFVEGIC